MNILYFVIFYNKEKKKNITDEAKKSIKKGEISRCS